MKDVRIGIIGAGNIARAHLPALMGGQGVLPAGVCDRVPGRAQTLSEEFGGRIRVFDSAEDMLKSSEVDAVVLAVPNYQHHPMCLAAAKHGKHILCEKPMALDVEQAEEMADICRKKGVLLALGFCTRFMPQTAAMKAHIDAGHLGDIYFARTDIIRQRGTPKGWFGNREKAGGGPLIDIGVHMIDAAWYLMGKPKPLRVRGMSFCNKVPDRHPSNEGVYSAFEADDVFTVEDSSHGLITFEGGRGLIYQASWSLNAQSVDERLDLYGDRGGLSMDPLMLIRNELHSMTETALKYLEKDCFMLQIEQFACAVRGEQQLVSPAEDGVAIQKILCGLYRSSEMESEVTL